MNNDLISRSALLEAMPKNDEIFSFEVRRVIYDAPAVDAEVVRTARWQFERRGKDGVTELPVCSGCGATPKYYVPKNDVGMQVPPYCHECGSKMAAVVKMEVE